MRIITTIIFLFSLKVFGQGAEPKLKIAHLTGDFYIFITYNLYKGDRITANGMYVVTKQGVVMVDSPWDTTQLQPLLDSIKVRHHKDVVMCMATHFHDDRTIGLEYFRHKGIKTYTTKKTDQLSKKTGKKRAEFLFDSDTTFTIGQYSFKAIFPGHGHAPDNIVVWFEKQRLLYGGCLIKSTDDGDLGYLGDASIKDYAATVKNVEKKCQNPLYVIPGHGDWSSTKSLHHTFEMAEELKKKMSK